MTQQSCWVPPAQIAKKKAEKMSETLNALGISLFKSCPQGDEVNAAPRLLPKAALFVDCS